MEHHRELREGKRRKKSIQITIKDDDPEEQEEEDFFEVKILEKGSNNEKGKNSSPSHSVKTSTMKLKLYSSPQKRTPTKKHSGRYFMPFFYCNLISEEIMKKLKDVFESPQITNFG